MISQDMISDEHFNAISLEAQNIFVRLLAVSDDCGVVPANIYKLNVLINTPKKLNLKLGSILSEIVERGLGHLFDFKGEKFFAFKPAAFADYQSYILKKSTKSEYLRIPKEEFEELSKNFQELPRNSIHCDEGALSTVESRKQKVESNKQEVESKEKKAFGEFQNVLLTDIEYGHLIRRLGTNERARDAIEILSAYKESKGKTYKSDYATFGTWVIGELEKRERNGKANGTSGHGGFGTKQSPSVEAAQRTLEKTERRIAARDHPDHPEPGTG